MKVKDLLKALVGVDKNKAVTYADMNLGSCTCNFVDIEVTETEVILFTNMVGT